MTGRLLAGALTGATASATVVSRLAGRLSVAVLVGVVRAYQLTLSPMFGPVCRFYPSCSHYAVGALRTHGAVRGTGMVVWRLMRCNPWNPGGVDLVPPRGGSAFRSSRRPACEPDCRDARPTDHSALVAATHDGAPDHPVRAP